jgi:hypothetical protein
MPSLVIEEAVPSGAGGAVTVIVALADFELSATLVAVTLKAPAALPAVYIPVAEIVPPEADQVTLVFDVPVTLAENCCMLPVCTDTELGLMVTVTAGVLGFEALELAEPTQLARPNVASKTQRRPAAIPDGCGFSV